MKVHLKCVQKPGVGLV